MLEYCTPTSVSPCSFSAHAITSSLQQLYSIRFKSYYACYPVHCISILQTIGLGDINLLTNISIDGYST